MPKAAPVTRHALVLTPSLRRAFAGSLVQLCTDRKQQHLAKLDSRDVQGAAMVVAELTGLAIHSLLLQQPCGTISLGFWLYGTSAVHSASKDITRQSGAGLLYYLQPGQRIELATNSPSCQWIHLTLELRTLRLYSQALEDSREDHSGLLDRLKPEAPFLTSILQRVLRSGSNGDQSAQNVQRQALEQVLFTHVASALQPSKPAQPSLENSSEAVSRSKQAQHVELALTYMEQHYASHLNLQTISGTCGVSARTLQATFLQRVGYSPMQALQTIRLTQLHRSLREGIPVAQSCEAAGLRMSGHLASIYRARFGELPRETLMRGRNNQG